jgi:hypothetical protein
VLIPSGDVGLGVGSVGVAGNVLLVQVLLVGGGGGEVERSTEAVVEGNSVGTIEGESTGIGVGSGIVEVEDSVDFLVELVR